ncbi:hypothetical protein CDAR_412171 [Caerostris darwini]|uniref:Uncharacterized protein n=1 Tax=Caerostris darwini TaxID=1538125 RepID=A0AAV4WDW1_9ARAC|nr:hypothetical protein CDAR_412171 [Caerostris darwini]
MTGNRRVDYFKLSRMRHGRPATTFCLTLSNKHPQQTPAPPRAQKWDFQSCMRIHLTRFRIKTQTGFGSSSFDSGWDCVVYQAASVYQLRK